MRKITKLKLKRAARFLIANFDKKTLLVGTTVAILVSIVLGLFESVASNFITVLETNSSTIFIGLYWIGCIAATVFAVYVATRSISFSLLAGFVINAVVQDFVSAVLRFGPWPFPMWNHIISKTMLAPLRLLANPMPFFPNFPNYYWVYLIIFAIGVIALKKVDIYIKG